MLYWGGTFLLSALEARDRAGRSGEHILKAVAEYPGGRKVRRRPVRTDAVREGRPHPHAAGCGDRLSGGFMRARGSSWPVMAGAATANSW